MFALFLLSCLLVHFEAIPVLRIVGESRFFIQALFLFGHTPHFSRNPGIFMTGTRCSGGDVLFHEFTDLFFEHVPVGLHIAGIWVTIKKAVLEVCHVSS